MRCSRGPIPGDIPLCFHRRYVLLSSFVDTHGKYVKELGQRWIVYEIGVGDAVHVVFVCKRS